MVRWMPALKRVRIVVEAVLLVPTVRLVSVNLIASLGVVPRTCVWRALAAMAYATAKRPMWTAVDLIAVLALRVRAATLMRIVGPAWMLLVILIMPIAIISSRLFVKLKLVS